MLCASGELQSSLPELSLICPKPMDFYFAFSRVSSYRSFGIDDHLASQCSICMETRSKLQAVNVIPSKEFFDTFIIFFSLLFLIIYILHVPFIIPAYIPYLFRRGISSSPRDFSKALGKSGLCGMIMLL